MLVDNLRKAHRGNYGVILSLLGCLDHGVSTKQLVDKIIDSCKFRASIYRLFEAKDAYIVQAIMS